LGVFAGLVFPRSYACLLARTWTAMAAEQRNPTQDASLPAIILNYFSREYEAFVQTATGQQPRQVRDRAKESTDALT
jgi:hypothetical protein